MSLMMSVSGVRGIVGQTMTPTLAAELGAAFASHLSGGTVVVGRDTRPSGAMLHSALVSGLMACGCNVVDLGVVSTPGVAVMVLEHKADGGVVITASHNPGTWNGIKFLTSEGAAPPPEPAQELLDRYREERFVYVDSDRVGCLQRDTSTHERHVTRVLGLLDIEVIAKRRFKVVLDSVNGAGGTGGRMLLERLGCQVVHVNAEPTGRFAHPPEPIAENLTNLCESVRKQEADLGFAQDPDADRLAIVDHTGRYIGEEYTLVLAAKFVLSRRPGAVAVNLSTSRMIDDLADRSGIHPQHSARPPAAAKLWHRRPACDPTGPAPVPQSSSQAAKTRNTSSSEEQGRPEGGTVVVHRTAVGEANVVRAMMDHGCVIGGEGNGGVIDPRVSPVRDSFTAMGLVLNLLAGDGRPLASIVDEMPRYVMIKQKFELDRRRINAWLDRVRGIAGEGRLDDSDGLRIDWPEGWVHVRPSNTEPIVRVIAEAVDESTATGLVKRVSDLR